MNLLNYINLFLQLYWDTARQLFRWRLWTPLVLYGLLQWLVLYAHYRFMLPVFYGPITAWVSLISPEQATAFTHYPEHFLLLGRFAGWAKIIVGIPLEGLVLGIVAGLFYRRFSGLAPKSFRSAAVRWFNLTLIWVVVNSLLILAGLFLPSWLGPYLQGTKRLLAFGFVVMPLVFSFLVAPFYLATPFAVIDGVSWFSAVGRSFRTFLSWPVFIFTMTLLTLSGPLVMGAVASQASLITRSFNPELVYWIRVLSLPVNALAYFIWMGTAVRFIQRQEL